LLLETAVKANVRIV